MHKDIVKILSFCHLQKYSEFAIIWSYAGTGGSVPVSAAGPRPDIIVIGAGDVDD